MTELTYHLLILSKQFNKLNAAKMYKFYFTEYFTHMKCLCGEPGCFENDKNSKDAKEWVGRMAIKSSRRCKSCGKWQQHGKFCKTCRWKKQENIKGIEK